MPFARWVVNVQNMCRTCAVYVKKNFTCKLLLVKTLTIQKTSVVVFYIAGTT